MKHESRHRHHSHIQGIIFDLQNNPGGPLSAALDLASTFLPKNKPLLQITSHNNTQIFKSNNRFADSRTPILLLVNEQTASASEIFASALQDHNRGVVAGACNTLGKNIAQVYIQLTPYHCPLLYATID